MSVEENKAAARRFFVDAFSEGKLEAMDEVAAPDAAAHDPGNPQYTGGAESAKGLVSMYRSTFPDLRFEVEDQIAEGDMVVTRWTGIGTHEGDLPDLPATGRRSTVSGITIDRFEGGKIVESWTKTGIRSACCSNSASFPPRKSPKRKPGNERRQPCLPKRARCLSGA